MAKPKLYIDACCLIEAIKGRVGHTITHPLEEVDMIERILKAARGGDIELFTSILTAAEVLYTDPDERPPPDDTKAMIERLILSGRDGIVPVSPTPAIARTARSLAWDEGIYHRSVDLIHVATALTVSAVEMLTIDGRLARKLNRSEIKGCKLIAARDTKYLPNEYRANDLFKEAGH